MYFIVCILVFFSKEVGYLTEAWTIASPNSCNHAACRRKSCISTLTIFDYVIVIFSCGKPTSTVFVIRIITERVTSARFAYDNHLQAASESN